MDWSVSSERMSCSSYCMDHSLMFWLFRWKCTPSSLMCWFRLSTGTNSLIFREYIPYTKYFPVCIVCSCRRIRRRRSIFLLCFLRNCKSVSKSFSLSTTNLSTPVANSSFKSSSSQPCAKNQTREASLTFLRIPSEWMLNMQSVNSSRSPATT